MPLDSLVSTQENTLGIGKLLSVSGDTATVEYFISVSDRFQHQVETQSLQQVQLQRHTRCYLWLEDEDRWQIGRVDVWHPDQQQYEIALPDKGYRYAAEKALYVRCNIPIEDPTSVLIFKGHETPFFHTYRSAFVRNLTEQRAISHGMPGLFSANIALYRHQVEVVRRVLEDPIQRYLLADEVGLGKTIEAGAILRQFLLDNPSSHALAIVPRSLKEQWRHELADKFYLTDEVQLVAAEDLDRVTLQTPHFLIMDEAHHIAAMAASHNAAEQRQFALCQRLAHGAQGVLLLSATPALNHEQAFLAMLHLLDPATYSLEDLEGFQARIHKRQDIGRVLLSFKETALPFVLKMSLSKLRNLFPEDPRLSSLVDQLQAQLEAEDPDLSKRTTTVRAIGTHISDTYRLHRRMLRNRRDSVKDVLIDQADALFETKFDENSQAERLHEYLDEWRIQALGSAEVHSDYWHQLSQIYRVLFLARGSWHRVLEWVVAARLGGQHLIEVTDAFGDEARRLILDTPHFSGEDELLEQLLEIIREIPEEEDRIYLLQGLITDQREKRGVNIPKLVVFTGYTQVGMAIARRLRARFGDAAIATLEVVQSAEVVEQQESQFKNNPHCFVLVCDASGEEGHNLQFADYMIHFDLPWSPNRLEQRHGRMNRIGLNHSMKYIVFLGSRAEDDPYLSWCYFLGDGLNLFKESIASLQFYVDRKLPECETLLFQEGADGFDRIIDTVQEEVKAEKVSIDEQNALDEIDVLDSNAAEYFALLDDYDGRHKEIQRATEGWVCNTLQFKPWFSDPDNVDFFWYRPTRRTLLPVNEIETFLPPKELHKPGTYNRRLANRRSGRVLYRSGAGIIDALRNYVQWDDRGRAFALWRHVPEWPADEGLEWVGYRFDYVIEADLSGVRHLLEQPQWKHLSLRALQRRADALFPPFFQTVFLDTRMQGVTDESLLAILNRPYSQRGQPRQDYSLAKKRLYIIDEFISRDHWEALCRDARAQSKESLRQSEVFLANCQRYAQTADRKLSERVEQLTLRLDRQQDVGAGQSLTEEVNIESEIKKALLDGMFNPRVSLDSIGFYIVSGRLPSQPGEAND
jgi:ATP-dependent helicase HepA